MDLVISRQHLLQLNDWADEAHPSECCGLLLGCGTTVREIVLTHNVSPYPQRMFEIDPAALIKAEKAMRDGGPDLIGYFHSHPNGLDHPSTEDAKQAMADGRFWVIIASGKATAWQALPGGKLYRRFNPIELIAVN